MPKVSVSLGGDTALVWVDIFHRMAGPSPRWDASRTLFRDLLSGLGNDASTLVEFGAFRKVGDLTTLV